MAIIETKNDSNYQKISDISERLKKLEFVTKDKFLPAFNSSPRTVSLKDTINNIRLTTNHYIPIGPDSNLGSDARPGTVDFGSIGARRESDERAQRFNVSCDKGSFG